MHNSLKTVLVLLWLASTPNSYAQARESETQVILHSTVTGNQEQPRVMYIVPWDHPADPRFEHELQRSIARELFDPIDRDEFVRSMTYQTKIRTVNEGEDDGKL